MATIQTITRDDVIISNDGTLSSVSLFIIIVVIALFNLLHLIYYTPGAPVKCLFLIAN